MAPTTDAQQRTRKIMKAAPNTGSLCFLQPGSPCGASVADLFWAWRPRGLPGAFPDLCRCVLAFLTIGLVRSSCGLRNRGAVSETTRKSCTLYLVPGTLVQEFKRIFKLILVGVGYQTFFHAQDARCVYVIFPGGACPVCERSAPTGSQRIVYRSHTLVPHNSLPNAALPLPRSARA